MKGYTLPCTLLLVFVMSITVEGCQETGEIKVNSNDKYIIVRVWICNISLICQWRLSHPGNINQVLRETHRLFSSLLEYFGGIDQNIFLLGHQKCFPSQNVRTALIKQFNSILVLSTDYSTAAKLWSIQVNVDL